MKAINKQKKLVGFVFCCLLIISSKAQDPQFSQYYANTLYLNPAFAGNNTCSNLGLSYRNQWAGLEGGYVTYSVAYDRYIKGISGGVGALITHDKSGGGSIATTTINLMYAYSATINRSLSFKAGMQFGYFQNSINWNELTFADMYDGGNGGTKQTAEEQGASFGGGMDMAAGGLLYSKKFFGGIAVHHLTQPQQPLFGYSGSRLLRKYTAHLGMNIDVKSSFGKLEISPNFLFQQQGKFIQYNMGFYVKKGPIILGGWYRWQDAIIALLGIDYNNFRFGYSFDYSVGKAGFSRPLASHEISCTYKFKCSKKVKYRLAKCPQF